MNRQQTVPAILGPIATEMVVDADEEVFILYTALQAIPSSNGDASQHFRGLGHVNSRTDTLAVKFELRPPQDLNTNGSPAQLRSEVGSVPTEGNEKAKRRRAKSSGRRAPAAQLQEKLIEVELWQDKTALRSRKGDTGSVLWKASIDFAQAILTQLHYNTRHSLFDIDILRCSHVLELGGGTGLLSLLFAPFVAHYTVTDIPDLVPLIQKNVNASTPTLPNVTVSALDWLNLQSTPVSSRARAFSVDHSEPDVLLVVDCIYHPALLPALVDTMDWLAAPGRTLAIVVVELRAEDVVREFLSLWLGRAGWVLMRVLDFLPLPYVVWVGWKSEDYVVEPKNMV